MSELRLDWATHKAALLACKRWHYTRSLPPPPMVHVGVWEGRRFIGVVLFSRGASPSLLSAWGLTQDQGCELTRVALGPHQAPVTKIVAVAIRLLRKSNPGLRLIVSFADPGQGHAGGIYQAGNWVYTGQTDPGVKYIERRTGREWHSRMVSKSGRKKVFGKERQVVRVDQCDRIVTPGKHRYLMPLDEAMRAQLLPQAKPFPKRHEGEHGPASASDPQAGV
jgi:hypothetical protein